MTSTNATGREYLRVSQDRSKTGRSPDQQHDQNVPAAASFGIELGEPYRDDDRSASRYATKAREGFDRLTSDLRDDTFGAEVLVLWESSRGSRQVSEWVELLELLEQRGVKVLVTTHHRIYDPANPRDRRSMIDDANDSEFESAKIRTRIRRDVAASAAKGNPHGQTPFGYERLYDPKTRRFVSQHEHPVEGPIIRELFARLERGDYLARIEKDFWERGFRTRKGARITSQNLRSFAENQSYAGFRTFDPQRWASHKHTPTASGQRIKAVWPALVSLRQFQAVQDILTRPERRTNGDTRTRHLLSMIIRCGVCGDPMSQSNGGKGKADPHYRCPKSHVRIIQPKLDELAEAMIFSFAEHPDHYPNLLSRKQDDAALAKVRDQLAEARADHDALADSGISVQLAAKREPEVLRRIALLEAKERELTVPPELSILLDPGQEIRRRWKDDLTIVVKRKLLRTLLSLEFFGEMRVQPTEKRGKGVQGPVTERIVLRRSRRGKVTNTPMEKLKILVDQ